MEKQELKPAGVFSILQKYAKYRALQRRKKKLSHT